MFQQKEFMQVKKLVCTVIDIIELYNPITLEIVKRIVVETMVNGHKEQFALPDDAYENIKMVEDNDI